MMHNKVLNQHRQKTFLQKAVGGGGLLDEAAATVTARGISLFFSYALDELSHWGYVSSKKKGDRTLRRVVSIRRQLGIVVGNGFMAKRNGARSTFLKLASRALFNFCQQCQRPCHHEPGAQKLACICYTLPGLP